jgi:hypothetical protein
MLGSGFDSRESAMMHGSITVFTVKDVMESLAYGLRDFDVADLDGDMIFFGMESKKA